LGKYDVFFNRLCFSALLFIAFSETGAAQGNSGSISLQARVPGTVQVSAIPNKGELNDALEVQYTKNEEGGVVIKVSGSRPDTVNLPIRLQIRSNIPYNLSALLSSKNSDSLKLTVVKTANTGRQTAGGASENIIINPYRMIDFF
jgi:hypothetical protein